MPIVESSGTIAASQDQVFAVAQDYDLRLQWDPFLRQIKFLGGATHAAVGVQVWVKAKNGLAMTVEYLAVQRPSHVAIKMVTGPFFFQQFGGTWRFEVVAPAQTQVRFRYSFRTRWPILRPILDPMIRLVFARDVRARILGLKRFMEGQSYRSH
jgi:ribosome-associated toxin RatA of RatAB toxin-antitoxin module